MRHRTAWYTRFAKWAARVSGRPATFVLALGLIGAWAIFGPVLQFNDTWQLTINTATTILTFLMVFVIQSTQNRDTQAIQIKLDELIRSSQGAHNALLDLEELEDLQLEAFLKRYETLAEEARASLKRGRSDTGTPEP